MRFTVFLDVLFILAEVIKDLGVRAARIALRGLIDATGTRPPVALIIVEENALARLDTTLIAVFLSNNISSLDLNTLFLKDFLPNPSSLFVLWNIMSLVTGKTGDVNLFWVETDDFGQELEEILDLLLLKIITKGPVTEHFENGSMARVANILNILEAKTRLRIGQALAVFMRLT